MMNILSISSILPVREHLALNDFALKFYVNLCSAYPDTRVRFVMPVKYSTGFLERLTGETTPFNKIRKLRIFTEETFTIETITFLSIQRFLSLHTLLSFTGYYFNIKRLKGIIQRNGIDLIHAQYLVPDGTIAYMLHKAFGLPYIVTTHNEIRYMSNRISRCIALKILRNAFLVTPVNHTNYARFQSMGLSNLTFIPLGFDRDLLVSGRKRPPGEEIRIISVASLLKLKNLDKVILALSRLKDKYRFIYSIAGEGPERKNLEKLIISSEMQERVRLLGRVPYENIMALLSEQDIFILVSYFETFGRVYFEAMAVGLPVICAKNSGIHGIFREMEQGLSADHSDIEDIRTKLELLISNAVLRRTIGENGKKMVQEYSWEKIAASYHNIYKKAERDHPVKKTLPV